MKSLLLRAPIQHALDFGLLKDKHSLRDCGADSA